jgi:hypothetical protein
VATFEPDAYVREADVYELRCRRCPASLRRHPSRRGRSGVADEAAEPEAAPRLSAPGDNRCGEDCMPLRERRS